MLRLIQSLRRKWLLRRYGTTSKEAIALLKDCEKRAAEYRKLFGGRHD